MQFGSLRLHAHGSVIREPGLTCARVIPMNTPLTRLSEADGVEVSAINGGVSMWVTDAGRLFWCPDLTSTQRTCVGRRDCKRPQRGAFLLVSADDGRSCR